MPNIPVISVIMSVYNGAEYIAESIDSILAQSFVDFEFIIIDDASTDTTPQILEDYAAEDNRIRILTNVLNAKIAASLNSGLKVARAPLIARMDADDWSHPERFAKQYAFMQANPDVMVCGTWLEGYELGTVYRYPLQDAQIRAGLLFDAMLAHPSAMMRRENVQHVGGYDIAMPPVEDYDLWTRLAVHGLFACLPECLLRYRTHPNIDRLSYRCVQINAANTIRERQLRFLGLTPSTDDMQAHIMLSGCAAAVSIEDWKRCRLWGLTLLRANAHAPYVPQDILRERVLLQWYKVGMAARAHVLVIGIWHDIFWGWKQEPLACALLFQSAKAFAVRVKNKLSHRSVPYHVDC